MTITRLPRIALLAAALGATVLATVPACTDSGDGASSAATTPTTAETALAARAHAAAGRSFTGTYAVSGTAATVRVWVAPTAYRVEVAQGTHTAALYGSPAGTVACSEQTGVPTVCYAVAAAGQAVPAAFDAGIERVFTRDLPALAAGARGFTVTEETPPAAVTAAEADARCFAVVKASGLPALTGELTASVDPGTYCLSDDGLPVQMRFASGTLTLVSHGGAPQPVALQVPVPPQPLPPGVAAPSAMPTLPRAFG